MALRLLPFRSYDETDVINIYSLATGSANAATTDSGAGDNGVFVKVSNGNFNEEVITYGPADYLGKTNYPFVASEMYPVNPLTLALAGSGELPLGLTLNQTARTDENGEKLLYNTTKKEELQAVLPGQSVPVATKGIFTLSTTAFDGAAALYPVGTGIKISNENAGAITGVAPTDSTSFGTVIGTGERTSPQGGLTDLFAGEYIVVKIG